MTAILVAMAASIVGLWVPAQAGRDACASDEAIRYRADGRFGDMTERGRWSLRGGVLTEITMARTAMADRPGRVAGSPRHYRVAWINGDRMRLTRNGRVAVLVRCPER